MKFLLPLLFLISIEGSAQIWHIKRSIEWNYPCSQTESTIDSFISLPGATFENFPEYFPYYYEIIEWQQKNPFIKADIVTADYEELNATIPDSLKKELTGRDLIRVSIGFASLKPYLQITVFPFQLNHDNGKLQRIKNLVIRIESLPDQSTKQSSSAISYRKSSNIDHSQLMEGNYYKIAISETGIYKLSYDQIKSMGFEDPSKVRIYGNGGTMLPEDFRNGNKDCDVI